jgi:hypothetical protein
MANRHTNKKLRSLVRRRMAETGESYQTALNALLAEASAPRRALDPVSVDIVVASYFGLPVTFAVFEATENVGRPLIVRMPSSRAWGSGVSMPMPMPMSGFRRAGWQ